MPPWPSAPSTLSRAQSPCGTAARARSPRGPRPYRRAMPVSTPHSSRNTSRSGAIPPTPASASVGHAARAAATSARPCSAACRLRLFHVQPHRRSARPTVHGGTRTPVRSASRSRHSAKVRWFASRSRPSNAASTSPAIRAFGPPPIRLAVRRPSTRASRARRWAVERPTANRRAAARGVAPASTAARTRPRRSAEYDPAIDTSVPPYGHRCPDFLAVRSSTTLPPLARSGVPAARRLAEEGRDGRDARRRLGGVAGAPARGVSGGGRGRGLPPFWARLGDRGQRRWPPFYVRALTLPAERKGVEPMAARVAPG